MEIIKWSSCKGFIRNVFYVMHCALNATWWGLSWKTFIGDIRGTGNNINRILIIVVVITMSSNEE